MSVQLNLYIQDEIKRLAELPSLNSSILEEFAIFVIDNHKKKIPKPPKPKPLTLAQLKSAIFQNFSVKNLSELKKSSAFKMATDGMDNFNLTGKEGWKKLYRKFIGILPNEKNQQGYGCINGINIFDYFKPWQVFGLDGKIANEQDVKNAYYALSKIYHPDILKRETLPSLIVLLLCIKVSALKLSYGKKNNRFHNSRVRIS